MKVHLDKWYKNAGGVALPPGDHDVADELGEYLVFCGAAEVIATESPEKPRPTANKRRKRPPANKKG